VVGNSKVCARYAKQSISNSHAAAYVTKPAMLIKPDGSRKAERAMFLVANQAKMKTQETAEFPGHEENKNALFQES